MALNYTKLGGSNASFQSMIQRFGVVTVMNAKVFAGPDSAKLEAWKSMQADAIIASLNVADALCTLETLKIANISEEGPTKTITGGQYANPLIKYGKTATMELQDALGSAAALDALCGAVMESGTLNGGRPNAADVYALHFGGDFEGPKTILGDTFFIDQSTGQQVKAQIIIYQFLPDSLFNLTQDAEGDASVFDMNGSLLMTDIRMKDLAHGNIVHGAFYSIVDPAMQTPVVEFEGTSPMIATAATGHAVSIDGGTYGETGSIPAGSAARVQVKDANDAIVFDQVKKNY